MKRHFEWFHYQKLPKRAKHFESVPCLENNFDQIADDYPEIPRQSRNEDFITKQVNNMLISSEYTQKVGDFLERNSAIKKQILELSSQTTPRIFLFCLKKQLDELADVFMLDDELKDLTVKHALQDLRKEIMTCHKAFVSLITAGMFANKNIPSDIGYGIGSFLDTKTIAKLTQVNKAAARAAAIEDRSIQTKPITF